MAKYLDQNGLLYFWQQVKPMIGAKVDKVEGKGLSTNDLTDELLTKLNGVAAGAQVNVLESVKVNGVEQTITDKGVNIAVPTKTSEITNDSGYLTVVTESNLDAALAEKVNAAAEGNHSHANKTVLDGITVEKVNGWDDAATKAHTHANKDELDLIAAGDKAKWDKAVSDLAAEITRAKAAEEANAGAAAAAKSAADAAQGAADAAQGAVDALAAKVGTVPADKTVVGMIADAQAAATYDDTALAGRVKAIEDDYLKAADKTALQGEISAAQTAAEKVATDLNGAMDTRVKAIEADYLKAADKTELTEAIATAKQEAIETVLGAGEISESYDTLKEVAEWIQNDTTNSAELINRVGAIEADYLKAADKTALQEDIDAVADLVDTNGKTVSAYVADEIAANVVILSNSEIDAILAQ